MFLVTGDGAFGFYPSEFNGAVLGGLKITALISNDGAWGTEKHGQLQVMSRPVNTLFGDVHYDLIGKAFGCHAERVTEPKEVGPALDRAIAAKETAVIDVVTDPDAGKLRKEDPRVQTIAFSDSRREPQLAIQGRGDLAERIERDLEVGHAVVLRVPWRSPPAC